ncbi:endonuclease [Psychromonas hadalis]|uniref:HNH endonuclease signature motif containing protein n=1 Tax=Psychromonas hadalis TaxID=211669 RepID=UPI003CCC2860
MRFYDQTGFVDSEIVYVDNVTFIASATTPEPITDLAENGSFEDEWTEGKPTGWTTMGSGIVFAPESSTVKPGSTKSGAFTLTSTSNQDLRQSVDVVNGKTYTLTMSIYHTDGGAKVRAYIGGNYNDVYSDFDLVNQWQDYSFAYTATENKSIDFGMRFYDVSGVFDGEEIIYIDNVTFIASGTAVTEPVPLPAPDPIVPTDAATLAIYYSGAKDKSGFALKTALYNIIKDHNTKTYTDLWTFISTYTLDIYFEKDNTILDIYSENASASDSYNFTPIVDQCGNYSGESSCYNREHSLPQSWFNKASPMVSDVHHIFATDGYVNGKRSNYPYGEVATADWTSINGSKLGAPTAALGYTGTTVFEPTDEFKGDLARAYFYMATRYEDIIGSWEENSDNANAVLDGTDSTVFEPWVIAMLKTWSENDPVSQKERDRNEAAHKYQGNRNPFVDHPEYVNLIWVD